MTAGTPDRLTRLEAIVEALAIGQQQLQQQVSGLATGLERLERNQEALQQTVGELSAKLDANSAKLDTNIEDLGNMIGTVAEEAAKDRAAIRESITAFRAEAAEDRQQAAIDRAEWNRKFEQMMELLQGRNGHHGN